MINIIKIIVMIDDIHTGYTIILDEIYETSLKVCP